MEQLARLLVLVYIVIGGCLAYTGFTFINWLFKQIGFCIGC